MDYGDDDRMNYYSASEGDEEGNEEEEGDEEEEEGNEEEEGGEEGDETEVMMVDDEMPVLHTPPPMNQIDNTKSILKRTTTQGNDENRTKKTVSFKPRKTNIDTERQKKLNELHKINCHFEDCNKTIHWRKRYGKRRLLDHAFSHCKEKFVECRCCEFSCQTTCQMRYHYRKVHADIKMSGFAQKKTVGVFSRRKPKIAQQDETEVIEMTCDDLNKFIQVNIYGRTLQELSKQGIVLESLLNDIGCSRIWIGEGCMYNSPDSHNTFRSTESNTKENALIIEQAPVLSTTYATINCPRFSTPAVENRVDLERKFTLNLPQTISRINSSVVDSWIEEAEQPGDVENVLHEIIEKVANERENFSTTITKISLPRYSTPIPLHEHFLNESAFKVPDAISEIAPDGEEEVIIEYAKSQ
ncbi:hypothetical protein CAEBREN_31137 [Caenorhabditis brenneri]|uniref:C2H2-type domain-containing protein n=1 Tax=Caenorhabditis brenneri TaxID=135651 RepID=G0NHA8_CAEBE|nr:hypothetical protein CAEBREN_31137 [Caenorhabditis brenneri]